MDLELTGKTALVTGSFRGTGMIIADSLLKEGVKTIVHGLKPNQAEEAVKELGAGVPFNADITTENGCRSLIDFTREFPVNILINNYGTQSLAPGMTKTAPLGLKHLRKMSSPQRE